VAQPVAFDFQLYPGLRVHPKTGALVRATLELIADPDHSFHVPARTGRSDEDDWG